MKRLLFYLALSLFSGKATAQYTAIPDPTFELHLYYYGVDDIFMDGQVPTASIDTVTILDLYLLDIPDLSGIEDFSSLVYLDCSYNLLDTIDVTNNVNLEIFNCERNYITDLNLTQNVNLIELNCNRNELDSLNVDFNTNLSSLSCNYNDIETLTLSSNVSLEYLSCNHNQISDLFLDQNGVLSEIDCSWNNIDSLEIPLPSLTYLECPYIGVSFLNLEQCINLETLKCQVNSLTEIDLTQNTQLEYLNFNSCSLNYLDLTQNVNLTELLVSGNNLACLNVKNGNNYNITTFWADYNPNLTCIEVDNLAYSASNWSVVDANASFSEDCQNFCFTEIEEEESAQISVYLNPVENELTINRSSVMVEPEVVVYNMQGREILNRRYPSLNSLQIQFNHPAGVYYILIREEGNLHAKKVFNY